MLKPSPFWKYAEIMKQSDFHKKYVALSRNYDVRITG
jgi:hypothetical protein